jgi:glucose/arabinose dehydrogenase
MLWSAGRVPPDRSADAPSERRVKAAIRTLVAVIGALALCVPAQPVAAALPLTQMAPGHGFQMPLYLTHAGDARLFVVEQLGKIKIIHPGGGVTTFIDLAGLVSQTGGERGLLGLAFHPGYASNGLFYVNYTRQSDGDTVIAEYRRSAANPDLANPASARIVLVIDQPAPNHHGGWIGFKGTKNMFIATGDGGGAPGSRPQSLSSLLGKILRINPLDPDGSGPRTYGIPPKNPYVGRTGRDEIWSRGLRNPWRCSHDRYNGRMWCADVGQSQWEEANRVRTGRAVNYGWPIMEGRTCYSPSTGCNTSGKIVPVAVYSHSYGCAITGGYVARRSGAAMYGTYFFADYCSGMVWAIPNGFSGTFSPTGHLLADTPYNVSSFGEGADGRLYLVDLGGGVYRLDNT